MFDYITLVPPVRRLINDFVEFQVDLKESTDEDSFYIKFSVDGYVYPITPSGILVNGVNLDDSGYTVRKNLIRVDNLIAAGSEVLTQYNHVTYPDERIIRFIGDTVRYIVQPIFNISFEFGEDIDTLAIPPSGYVAFKDMLDPYVFDENTWTNQDIDNDFQSLFVYGTALEILGVKVTEAGDDAIFIKDGDTTIDTAASSREKSRGYAPIVQRWKDLLQVIQTNRFEGFSEI